MQDSTLNNISEELYTLLLSFNKKVFNPSDLIKRFNVAPSQVRVLFYLIHHGPSSISQVGNDLLISKPNMTPIIDKLVSENLVERFRDPDDRRIIRIKATENACIFLKEQESKIKIILKDKISTLPLEDINNLPNLINKLNIILNKIER